MVALQVAVLIYNLKRCTKYVEQFKRDFARVMKTNLILSVHYLTLLIHAGCIREGMANSRFHPFPFKNTPALKPAALAKGNMSQKQLSLQSLLIP